MAFYLTLKEIWHSQGPLPAGQPDCGADHDPGALHRRAGRGAWAPATASTWRSSTASWSSSRRTSTFRSGPAASAARSWTRFAAWPAWRMSARWLEQRDLVVADGRTPLDISLLGVEPGHPASRRRSRAAARPQPQQRGDPRRRGVDGPASGRRHPDASSPSRAPKRSSTTWKSSASAMAASTSLQPSVFVPYLTWEKVRPQAAAKPDAGSSSPTSWSSSCSDPADAGSRLPRPSSRRWTRWRSWTA